MVVSASAIVRALKDPCVDRPRGKGTHLNVKVREDMVEYDCPVCKHHNVHKWYGREYHFCNSCEQPTLIRG